MDNFFSYDFTEGRMDLPPEAIGPLGSNCFSRGSILLILRKPIWLIATCDFRGGRVWNPCPRPFPSLDPPTYQNDDQAFVDIYFSERKDTYRTWKYYKQPREKQEENCYLLLIYKHSTLQTTAK